jgi:hypothetical protein
MSFITAVMPSLPESSPVADNASVASSVKVSRPQDPLTAQIERVAVELESLKKLAKLVGKTIVAKPKKDPSAPKGETPAQLKVWNTLVDSVLEELRTVDPKATRAQAMTEARKRQDASDPEGAVKREAARLKRQETAARKKADKESLIDALASGVSITEALAESPAKERAKRAPMSEEAKANAAAKRAATIAAKKATVGGGAGAPISLAATTTAAPPSNVSALKAKLASKKSSVTAVVPFHETLPAECDAQPFELNGIKYWKTSALDYLWEQKDDGDQGDFVGKLVGGVVDARWPEPAYAE